MVELDARRFKTRDESHDYLSEVLSFPDYYGRNLDALHDCLTERSGLEIRVTHYCEAGAYFHRVLQVLFDSCEVEILPEEDTARGPETDEN